MIRPATCLLALAACALALCTPGSPARAQDEASRWRAEAARVEIVRDDWGIAHVHGRTDADAVFGMIYAQAEDDFHRVEMNYVTALGRTAEVQGEGAIWADLKQRLFTNPDDLKRRYAASPVWLKALMDAWADGLNFYLASHPRTTPVLIRRFEPWMALSFSEGSIGGDLEKVSEDGLQAFYGGRPRAQARGPEPFREPSGSNGIAIAPSNTRDGHALLLINPHTSFFFRSELQMSSDEGLDAYGAATWGQFFLYQGFNPHVGWMHTTSGADVVDEFAETIVRRDGRFFYRYGAELRPVQTSTLTIAYRTASGVLGERRFTVYRTHHGPIVREAGGRWIAASVMNRPVEALSQSYLRTKASDWASFLQVAQAYLANSSNNTVFADDKGEITFAAPQFIPLRDDRFDYTRPVDGADPATDWRGITPLADDPHVLSPPNGWIANTNDWPYSAAGDNSPKAGDFPRYMDTVGENARGVHARRLLEGRRDFTLEGLRAAAFDPWLPAFAKLVPALARAYDATPASDPARARLQAQVALLRGWDDRWGAESVATSLAVYWGEALWTRSSSAAKAAGLPVFAYMTGRARPEDLLGALADASDRLTRDFGDWRVPWGRINRFQRLDDAIAPHFDDAAASLPVPFTSSQWGSLASFGTHPHPDVKKRYGAEGNSFVAVVEFGPRVRAVAVTAGGESGRTGSSHFDDQAQRYASGALREVYFYPDQLAGHTERRYHPGG